jgi:membrane protein DedA with SNARE-associated domain
MMNVEALIAQYGLAAIFLVMLLKASGVPIPIPGDVILLAAASRAATGTFVLWQAFLALLLALAVGSTVQYLLVRGPGRGVVYRYGRYLGLTPTRLDAASATVQRGGAPGVAVAIFTPGVRAVSVAACGLAGVPLRTFLPAMVAGTAAFLAAHFAIGYAGAALLARLFEMVPTPAILVVALLAAGLVAWMVIRWRQRPEASAEERVADAAGAWQEATCPVCLILGGTLGGFERAGAAIVLTQAP